MSSDAQAWFARLCAPCPEAAGTRIELLEMPNDPDPVPPGSIGTVRGGNGAQIFVAWDNGRTLALLVGHDRYRVVANERRRA